MKITIYTISDCQFSKQEKDYLNANKLTFEEKNLETNKEFLTEMLAVSNNFAGTPVTKIEKDDGKITVLKGFTKEEFDTALELVQPTPPAVTKSTESPTQPPSLSPTVNPPVAPPTSAPPAVPPVSTPTSPPTPPNVPNPLNSILNDLEAKSNAPTPPPASPNSPTNLPSIPDFGKTN